METPSTLVHFIYENIFIEYIKVAFILWYDLYKSIFYEILSLKITIFKKICIYVWFHIQFEGPGIELAGIPFIDDERLCHKLSTVDWAYQTENSVSP